MGKDPCCVMVNLGAMHLYEVIFKGRAVSADSRTQCGGFFQDGLAGHVGWEGAVYILIVSGKSPT